MAMDIPVKDLRRPHSMEKVEEYMTKDPLCFTRETTLEEAIQVTHVGHAMPQCARRRSCEVEFFCSNRFH